MFSFVEARPFDWPPLPTKFPNPHKIMYGPSEIQAETLGWVPHTNFPAHTNTQHIHKPNTHTKIRKPPTSTVFFTFLFSTHRLLDPSYPSSECVKFAISKQANVVTRLYVIPILCPACILTWGCYIGCRVLVRKFPSLQRI